MISNKVMFLDIDGVLCTLRSHFAYQNTGGLNDAWDIGSCIMIRRLCEEFGVAIVISSSWRIGRRQILNYYLTQYGLNSFLYGANNTRRGWCPIDTTEDITPIFNDKDSVRGDEIDAWLKAHPTVTQYVIIDDDSDFLEHQKPFHVHTEYHEGFGAKHYMETEKLLQGETNA